MLWNQYDNSLGYFFFNSVIVPRHIESTILRLSNSWYPTTSTTPNTYIDYWIQADAIQSLNVDPSLTLCYTSMPSSDYLKMAGMDKYATLKM